MRSSGSKRRSSAFGGSKTALSTRLGEFYPWEALTQQGTGAAGAPQPGVARSRVSRGEVAGATLLVHGWPRALHAAASTARSALHTPELPRQCVSPQQNPNAALREPHGSPKTSTRCTGPSSMCPCCPCFWCPDKCWVCSGQSKNPATEGPQPRSGPKLCKFSASGTSANPPLPCLVKAAAVLKCVGGTGNKPTSLPALWRRKGGELYNLRAVIERVC